MWWVLCFPVCGCVVDRALYSDYYIKAGLLMVDSGVKLGDLVDDAGGEDDIIYHGIEKSERWDRRLRLRSGYGFYS